MASHLDTKCHDRYYTCFNFLFKIFFTSLSFTPKQQKRRMIQIWLNHCFFPRSKVRLFDAEKLGQGNEFSTISLFENRWNWRSGAQYHEVFVRIPITEQWFEHCSYDGNGWGRRCWGFSHSKFHTVKSDTVVFDGNGRQEYHRIDTFRFSSTRWLLLIWMKRKRGKVFDSS